MRAHDLKSEDGAPISATRIRLLLAKGDLDEANKLLGRPYQLRGTVLHGRGEGGAMGFHTANLSPSFAYRVLGEGVYAAYADYQGQRYTAITNIGGIRNPLMQGEITLGEIYSIFPFDNTLCLIKLKGSDLRDLFDIIASRGGEAVSHEVRMTIADDKAANLTIDGAPLDDNRIYSIATIDYVANGGDHMTPCLKATERKNSAAFLRDVVINYIEKATQAKRAISALDEARITPAKPQ